LRGLPGFPPPFGKIGLGLACVAGLGLTIWELSQREPPAASKPYDAARDDRIAHWIVIGSVAIAILALAALAVALVRHGI
jgi:hypothetical protein